MKTLRILACAFAALLFVRGAWAQEAQTDVEALKAQSKQISKELAQIRAKYRKNPEVMDLYKQWTDLRKQIDEKYAELDPKYGELAKQRQEIYQKLRGGKKKKGRKKRGRKKKAEK